MSEKWTKGPWFAITCPHDERRHLRIDSNPGAEWASCSQIAYAKPSDAHLIAAAPEMYEALRRCVDALDATMGDTDLIDEHDDGSEEFQAFRAGLAALEKARGER